VSFSLLTINLWVAITLRIAGGTMKTLKAFNEFCEGKGSPEDLATAITFSIMKDLKGRRGFKEAWEDLGDSKRDAILTMNVTRAWARLEMAEETARS
jgi:hypothetical protein